MEMKSKQDQVGNPAGAELVRWAQVNGRSLDPSFLRSIIWWRGFPNWGSLFYSPHTPCPLSTVQVLQIHLTAAEVRWQIRASKSRPHHYIRLINIYKSCSEITLDTKITRRLGSFSNLAVKWGEMKSLGKLLFSSSLYQILHRVNNYTRSIAYYCHFL